MLSMKSDSSIKAMRKRCGMGKQAPKLGFEKPELASELPERRLTPDRPCNWKPAAAPIQRVPLNGQPADGEYVSEVPNCFCHGESLGFFTSLFRRIWAKLLPCEDDADLEVSEQCLHVDPRQKGEGPLEPCWRRQRYDRNVGNFPGSAQGGGNGVCMLLKGEAERGVVLRELVLRLHRK